MNQASLRPQYDKCGAILWKNFGQWRLSVLIQSFKVAVVGGYKIEKLPKLKNVFENTNYMNTNMVSSLFSALL